MPSRRQRQSKYRKWMNEFTSGQLEVASFWTFWKKSWCWLLLVVMAVTVTVMMMKWRTNGEPIKIIFFPNSVRISNPIKGMRVCVYERRKKCFCAWCFFPPFLSLNHRPNEYIFKLLPISMWDLIIYSFSFTSFLSNIHSTAVIFDRIFSSSFLFR